MEGNKMEPIIQLIVCENASNMNGKSVIENPFSLISFPFMPTSASFRLSIVVAQLDEKRTHDFRVTMYKKDSPDILVFDSGVAQMGPFQPPSPELTRLENLNLEFSVTNVPIRSKGVYVFKIEINETFKTQEIFIDHVEEKS